MKHKDDEVDEDETAQAGPVSQATDDGARMFLGEQ
jgi:hypothetical protein